MKQATEHKWVLVINGADRGDLSKAFRESHWKDTWHDRVSPMDDDDPDAGYCVSLPIPDLDTLIAALKCVGDIRATLGISLYGSAEFGSLRANYSLCTQDSGFEVSSSVLHRTVKSFGSAMETRLTEAEKALGELRMLVAESESA